MSYDQGRSIKGKGKDIATKEVKEKKKTKRRCWKRKLRQMSKPRQKNRR